MRVAVLSDTHAPRRWKSCPDAVAQQLQTVDLIMHAGDVCTPAVLAELATWAPVYAVRGNNDGPDIEAWGAPERLSITLGGLRVAMVHDSGSKTGRAARLRCWFPDAQLVIFGHSHIPFDEQHDGQRIFNPGSPTDRRRQPYGTMGLITIEATELLEIQLLKVT